jgi:hypothetical protein
MCIQGEALNVWGFFGAALIAAGVSTACGAAPKIKAEKVVFECDFASGTARDGNWVPSKLYILKIQGKEGLVAYDPVIEAFVGDPVPAEVIDQSKARITYGWEYEAEDSASQSFKMIYRFTYFRNGLPAKMSAQPGGYDNSWSGEGRCKASE